MPPKTRKSNADTVYVAEAPLHQRTFPSRKQTRRPVASSTLTAAEKKKQQTLTQIRFPIFLSDDESDEGNPRPVKRRSVRQSVVEEAEESDDDWEQTLRRPKRRRISPEPKSLPSSNRSARRSLNMKEEGQKTLTQAGYLLRRGLGEMPDSDDDAFELYEDSDVDETPKTEEETIRIRDSAEIPSHEEDVRDGNIEAAQIVTLANPRTPRHRKTLEVPSSQSPADLPLSTQSSRSWKDYERSPLRERSGNIRSPRARISAQKSQSTFTTGSENTDNASVKGGRPWIPAAKSQRRAHEVVEDSDNEETTGSPSPVKTATNISVSLGDSWSTDEGHESAQNHPWTRAAAFSSLPQPRWSQLEHRDVTQHVRSQASSVDGPSAQLLDDLRSATQRITTEKSHSEPDLIQSGQDAGDIIRQSQVSTVGSTQPTPRTQSSRQSLSSPPRTSPFLQRFPTDSREDDVEVQVPSSPQLMLPPPRKPSSWDQNKGDSQRRVTFSQLVPESLRDTFSSGGPMWTQEDDEL